jgi:hypothetical protein
MRLWFDCRHKQTSFPITRKNRQAGPHAAGTTYVVCLECGREFPYDWAQMKIIKNAQPESVTVEAQYEPALPG